MPAKDLETIVSLAKRRGFVFPAAEIYGGFANTYDYGPLGVELKRNIREAWWKSMVRDRDDVVGIDAALITNPRVWVASGHVSNFNDPLVDCKKCQMRWRLDHIEEGQYGEVKRNAAGDVTCPNDGGELTEPRQFNMMFKTQVGTVADEASIAYLPPETAQGIFPNFENVVASMRRKLPFGIAQSRVSFRNEITPGKFIFRTLEFEQMEMEYFCQPPADRNNPVEYLALHQEWINTRLAWYRDTIGIDASRLRIRDHEKAELSHYSAGTADVEYLFPWGWGELEGIAARTDFDLTAHGNASGHPLTYFDEDTKQHVVPWVIEPAAGLTRTLAVAMLEAYNEELDEKGETRVVLKFKPAIAPIKVAVLPLSKNEALRPAARRVYEMVRSTYMAQYDETQSIGRRYRRQDEIGTPLCITVDFQTVGEDGTPGDDAVTIRERDSQVQVRVPISGLLEALRERLPGC
ncbi:MAG: glycine--tRNA ligase [Dehalococcoidia bacterium]|uniref:glycine--tRNA ligase n=1 Tax=Candidatus Amarobacter glycogenicus TaxID=3140699 RepID=UPI003135DFCE|nr:glycine--tRNA ligase [Dehalococcoidia bacterium]MBK7125603.1 glycine--tRNA ligase [Dehalococcoidia bacterium]MBK8559177.1 glycine--tRNA ligase [Dehalococcoidia bacterium]MBK9344754.1 glycine--tRNA ligase [Dehalococcoidia bacterium]